MKKQLEMTNNPSAKDWAEYFIQYNPDCNISEDIMLGWFANAMMAMHDYCRGIKAINGDHMAEIIGDKNDG